MFGSILACAFAAATQTVEAKMPTLATIRARFIVYLLLDESSHERNADLTITFQTMSFSLNPFSATARPVRPSSSFFEGVASLAEGWRPNRSLRRTFRDKVSRRQKMRLALALNSLARAPVTAPNENPARFPKAGSREPSWSGRYEELCYGGSASQTHGRGKGSSRNLRHEQSVGHSLLKIPDHLCFAAGDRDCHASPTAVLNSTT